MTFPMTRRRRLAAAWAMMGTFLLGSGAALAQPATPLEMGFNSPVPGPLAGFEQADGYLLERAREALAAGVTFGGLVYSVETLHRDSQSDPARAGQLARELMIDDGEDIMVAVSTPEKINPVLNACYLGRGAQPGEPSPFKYALHVGFGMNQFYRTYVSQRDLIGTDKKVGVIYPNDANGNAVRGLLAPQLVGVGDGNIDPGACETGASDFSQQIHQVKDVGVEILNTFPIPLDFAATWREPAQQGVHRQVKIPQTAKTGMFPADIEGQDGSDHNISGGDYRHRDFPYISPVTGLDRVALYDCFEATTCKHWAQRWGAGLSTLKADNIAGVVDFGIEPVPNVASCPIISMQWQPSQGGKFPLNYGVTGNATDSNVPLNGTLVPYGS